jgi:CRP-like cAMP-binding protein
VKKNARIELLRGVWLFERCSRAELTNLASATTAISVPAGKVLAREGDVGREFFVIVSGTATATRNRVTIGTLGPGDFFGEMALLDRQPRAATVTTREPTELLVLTTQAFTGMTDTMPSVDRKMLAVLARRLRDMEDRYLPAERYTPTQDRPPTPAKQRDRIAASGVLLADRATHQLNDLGDEPWHFYATDRRQHGAP